MLKIVILLSCVLLGYCSRILVIFPVPSKTHSIISDSVVRILLDGGHDVTYVSAYTKLKPTEHLRHIKIKSTDFPETDDRRNLLDVVKSPKLPGQILEQAIEYSKHALQHENVQEVLLDPDEHFEAVIAEWYYSGLLAPLAALYDCPLIWYTCEDVSWVSLKIIHEQPNPAYSVDLLSSNLGLRRDIWSRIYRIWRQLYLNLRLYYTTYYKESSAYHEIYQPLFQRHNTLMSDYESLLYNGSLLIINSHPTVSQNFPLPNNAKYIGGHHIEESFKLLPQRLQEILDTSTKGVILFSLGTEISSKDLPLKIKWQLMDVFGELEQTVLWKVDEYLEDLPKNVFAVKWMPQRTILNHTNTILFINQGGFTSNIEAAYFGVTAISVPIYGDQFVSADLMVAAGRGLRVDFGEEFPQKLKEAINTILDNESYRKSAKATSLAFRQSLVPPSRELLHWVELVITTQGAAHLRSPALHLTVFERLHLDVLLLLAMCVWFLSKVIKVVKVYTEEEDEDKKNR